MGRGNQGEEENIVGTVFYCAADRKKTAQKIKIVEVTK
jgi:hypothetical protein